jgi:hypothetical protein
MHCSLTFVGTSRWALPCQGPNGTTDVSAVVEGIDGTVIVCGEERAGRFRVLQLVVAAGPRSCCLGPFDAPGV